MRFYYLANALIIWDCSLLQLQKEAFAIMGVIAQLPRKFVSIVILSVQQKAITYQYFIVSKMICDVLQWQLHQWV